MKIFSPKHSETITKGHWMNNISQNFEATVMRVNCNPKSPQPKFTSTFIGFENPLVKLKDKQTDQNTKNQLNETQQSRLISENRSLQSAEEDLIPTSKTVDMRLEKRRQMSKKPLYLITSILTALTEGIIQQILSESFSLIWFMTSKYFRNVSLSEILNAPFGSIINPIRESFFKKA